MRDRIIVFSRSAAVPAMKKLHVFNVSGCPLRAAGSETPSPQAARDVARPFNQRADVRYIIHVKRLQDHEAASSQASSGLPLLSRAECLLVQWVLSAKETRFECLGKGWGDAVF